MKKILSILAAISFTASVSSTVVACGTSSTSSSKQYDGINWGNNNTVLLTLADGTKVTVGEMLKNNSSDLDAYLMNYINGLVANRYTSDYAKNTLVGNNNLGFMDLDKTYSLQNKNTKTYGYADEINNYGMIASALDLYRQYVSALIGGGLTLDQQYIRRYHLNPVWDKTAPNGTNGRYSVWYSEGEGKPIKRWTTIKETNLSSTNAGTKTTYADVQANKYLPTADELNKDTFYLIKDTGPDDKPTLGTGWSQDSLITGDDTIQYDSSTGLPSTLKIVQDNLSGQQALLLRYQSEVQSTTTDSMLNALVMEYAKNNLYKMQSKPKSGTISDLEKATNKSLYVDTSSTTARDIQNWPDSNSDLVTSNYKMVWSLTIPKENVDAAKIQDAVAKFTNIKPHNSKLISDDYALLSDDKNAISSDMDALAKALGVTPDANKSINASKNGTDPYFGISGYQGIVKDGKSVDGGTLNIDSGAVDKIKNVEGMGLLANGKDASGTTSYTFTNKDEPNDQVDFVFVMPLYLMDLLRSGDVAKAPDTQSSFDAQDANTLNNIALNQWVPLNPQVYSDKPAWTAKSDFSKSTVPYAKSESDDTLPSETSLFKNNGITYVFIPTKDATKPFKLVADGQTVTVNPEDTSKTTPNADAYGVEGIYETTESSTKEQQASWKYNGQNTKYAIHLGIDNSNPDSYKDLWTSNKLKEENVNDIADLSSTKKDDLMNTLLASIAKNDSSLQEEAKNAIYRNYIALNDIKYKGIYDKISKYLKEDDNTDDTN